VPDAAVGVNDNGSVSLTMTGWVSLSALPDGTEGVKVIVGCECAGTVPLSLSVFVNASVGDVVRLCAWRKLIW
jgi:hypothetical protein